MTRELHVRFCEGEGVRFPFATRRLAKAMDSVAQGASPALATNSPTLSVYGGTEAGVILGNFWRQKG